MQETNILFKICMLIPTFPPHVIGGAQSSVMRLSVALKKNYDVEPWIMTMRFKDSATKEIRSGICIRRINCRGHSLGFFLGLPRLFQRNLKFIHVHTMFSPVIMAALARLVTRKHIVVKAPSGEQLITFFSRPTGQYLAKRIAGFIAITPEIVQVLLKFNVPEHKIWIIPNGIDTEEYSFVSPEMKKRLRERLGIQKNSMMFSFVGRLVVEKDIPFLLKAWALLPPRSNKDCLFIIGDGPQREMLEKLSESLGITASVKFVGELEPSQVKDYVSASDGFLLTSKGEGMSNALIEAMALGTPVIVSENAAVRTIVEHRHTGLRIKTKSELKNAILEIYQNKELVKSMRQAAHRNVVDQFSIQKIADLHMQMYQQILGEQRQ
ncbi:glycosyltransferase family 4 protein [candidate division KSB1 bacterium]|nr:glycosyltransferase family 4 protein [candidate division KSB1 bacterium]